MTLLQNAERCSFPLQTIQLTGQSKLQGSSLAKQFWGETVAMVREREREIEMVQAKFP